MAIIEIKFTRRGLSIDEINKKVQLQYISLKKAIKVLAHQTSTQLKQFIINHLRHKGMATGNLAEIASRRVIIFETKDTVSIGIGPINVLDFKAPEWYIYNYGGFTWARNPNKKRVPGFFNGGPPIKGQTGGAFQYAPHQKGNFMMTVNTPFIASHYIEKTIGWLNAVGRVHLNSALSQSKIN